MKTIVACGTATLILGLVFMAAGKARAEQTLSFSIRDDNTVADGPLPTSFSFNNFTGTFTGPTLANELVTIVVTPGAGFTISNRSSTVYMLDSPGGPVSDILNTTINNNVATFQFGSDLETGGFPTFTFPLLTASTLVETGASQGLLTLTGSSLAGDTLTVTINATSEVEAVPEPSSVALAAIGGIGLLGYAYRRRKRAA